ncbi:PaaI family thioesterase [Rhodospirillaceae bacterium SYSU D60014]|uniref:PaaI family thioesterase n=1 Tax=Virgifigura deserti TaxID=2268457 RepID=UPI000E673A8F
MLTDPDLEQAFAKALEDHEFAFERFFLARLFGFEFAYDDETCTVSLAVRPWMHNPRKSLHGGVIALGLDISMGHLLNRTVGPAATVETKVQYLRPVTGGTVTFQGEFIKRGRALHHLQSRLFTEDSKLAAFATATWAPIEPKPDRA